MAISTDERYLLNYKMGSAAAKVRLGDKIADAEGLSNDQVSLEHLDSGIEYTHRAIAGGRFTTAGGDANESITVSGLLATDNVWVHIHTKGATPRTLVAYAAGSGAIAVEMSGDPSTDHVLEYLVFRAAS